jgi:MFS family permease
VERLGAATSSRLHSRWPQFGVPAGLFLANLAALAFSQIAGSQFLDWGWRIPFFLSIILVGIGLYIRLGILETATFARLVAENRVEKTPAVEVIRRQPKQILLTALARMGEQAPFYIFNAPTARRSLGFRAISFSQPY